MSKSFNRSNPNELVSGLLDAEDAAEIKAAKASAKKASKKAAKNSTVVTKPVPVETPEQTVLPDGSLTTAKVSRIETVSTQNDWTQVSGSAENLQGPHVPEKLQTSLKLPTIQHTSIQNSIQQQNKELAEKALQKAKDSAGNKRSFVANVATKRSFVDFVPLELLEVYPGHNSRDMDAMDVQFHIDEIAASMASEGWRETDPAIVWVEADKAGNEHIYVSNGECRRLAAHRAIEKHGAANLSSVPVIVEPKGTTARDRVLTPVISNNGLPLKPYEQAKTFKNALNLGMTVGEIAKKTGFTSARVSQLLSFASMPTAVVEAVKEGKISEYLVRDTKSKAASAEELEQTITAALRIAETNGEKKVSPAHIAEAKVAEAKTAETKPLPKAVEPKTEPKAEPKTETKAEVSTEKTEESPESRATTLAERMEELAQQRLQGASKPVTTPAPASTQSKSSKPEGKPEGKPESKSEVKPTLKGLAAVKELLSNAVVLFYTNEGSAKAEITMSEDDYYSLAEILGLDLPNPDANQKK